MGYWVNACESASAPPPDPCTSPVWVDVSAAVPFELTAAHLSTMGEVFAAGVFIVVAFWGLGFAADLILNAIRRH